MNYHQLSLVVSFMQATPAKAVLAIQPDYDVDARYTCEWPSH